MRGWVLGVVLAASAGNAFGQAFAVFSPDAVKQIAAQKDSALGVRFVRDANERRDFPTVNQNN